MKEGYVPFSRKLFEHPFWLKKRTFSYAEAWIDLIRRARFDESTGKVLVSNHMIEYNRGEVVASIRMLSQDWGWGKSKVSSFLELLENENMIIRRTAPNVRQTIINICNYDKYNIVTEAQKNSPDNKPDNKRTTSGLKQDNTNKEKKVKKEKESDTRALHPEYKQFMDWMAKETPDILRHFPETISEDEFFRLKEKYTGTQIAEILLRIENRRDLHKRYKNLYRTTLNWLKNEHRNI